MKWNKSKYILITALSVLAVAAVGCKDKDEKSSSVVDEAFLKQPFTFSYGEQNNNSGDPDESSRDEALDNQDPTMPQNSGDSSGSENSSSEGAGENSEPATEYVNVTEADGEPVTEYVPVTDAEGEPQTDTEGQEETTAVQVTEAVTVPVQTPTEGENKTEAAEGNGEYTPGIDTASSFWFDISEEKDFVFNDTFISVTFKIKENTPEGVYDIIISNPDFANYGEQTILPDKVMNGKIYVSQSGEAQAEIEDGSDFVVYAENTEGNPGDEVTVNFKMKNNPGMCAMNFQFQYDKNAFEIVESCAVGEFAGIAGDSLE